MESERSDRICSNGEKEKEKEKEKEEEEEDEEEEEEEEGECSEEKSEWRTVSEEESEKWKMEKERYEEVIEYIREVDEILNLIRPFPREESLEKRTEIPRREVQSQKFGLDHLENILKLVEQLKEIQENNYKGERNYFLKDLRKLREHKKRLKNEEILIRNRVRSITSPEEYEMCVSNRKSSSTSEKFEQEPKDRWQDKRKSICLGENRSKVSKWTKVKEAFHWEKTSQKEKADGKGDEGPQSRDHSPDDTLLDVFVPPPSPPPPPPRPQRPENLLSVRPVQDLPSSSSSDRLDDFLIFSETKDNKTSDLDSPVHPFGADDIEEGECATRKSSCEELVQHLTKDDLSRSSKSNRTAWGKVKDIIQTRKDSLKKKPKKRGSDEFKKRRKLSTVSNPLHSDQFEDLSSPEEKVKNMEIIPKTNYEFPEEVPSEEKSPKRLTPALTVTLPSTEELRFSFDESDKRDNIEEEKSNILSQFSCQAQYCEDKGKFGKNKSGSNQRLSRWIKVKRVFLTSGAPAHAQQYLPGNNSSPTNPNKSSGFFSDMESDDLSSGEWIDDKSPSQEKTKPGYPEPQSAAMSIQEDIRKSYNELQKKLSQEFDQKVKEWEVKNEIHVKSEETSQKNKPDEGDCIPKFRKGRDSIAVPLPNLNDLSPEFKKKLNDWKKMKTSQSSSSVSSSATKDDIQGQNIKSRIGEWQPWRTRCSGKGGGKSEQSGEESSRKVEEGLKNSGSSRPPANRRKEEEGGGFSTNSIRRGSKRRESVKKISHSRTSSGGDSLLSTSSAEKDGRFNRKSQKVKDFHWVEKELQKIEREKLRLEQEKEKYLEREARLEKMKKTMGASPTQEILVRTPEGFVRFKGISQKFTKKLYEWEKARNIAPEASTFALLEESAQTGANGDPEGDGVAMQRSKSTGSVPELSSTLLIQTMAHHPSSLSLNDVDELKTREDEVEEAISLERIKDQNDEPEAMIVDVEDVVEETAVLEDPPFQGETPVYAYTSEEISQMLESRGRFYIPSGFGIKISNERDKSGTDNYSGGEFDSEKCCSESKIKLNNTETTVFESFSENAENEKIVEGEDARKKIKDVEEERISEEPFHASVATNSDCRNSKTKADKKTDKTEVSGEPETQILPLGKSSRRVFSQWPNGSENTKRPASDRSEMESSPEKKLTNQEQKTDSETLKRKIKEKITLMQRMSTDSNWKCNEFDYKKTTESTCKQGEGDRVGGEKDVSGQKNEGVDKSEPVNVFVPTTRKIISPVKTTEGATPSVCSYVIDDVKPEKPKQTPLNKPLANAQDEARSNSRSASPILQKKRDIGIPPLPNSPKMFKKVNPKETAPSIRMIIAKYNQKISEHDTSEGKRNESGSPIWRSPVFGRRTLEKIERYSGRDDGKGSGEVQKSASLDNMRARMTKPPPQDHEAQIKGILKSSSVGIMRVRPQNHEPAINSSPTDVTLKETSPSVLRALKIQKAKEDFLSGRLGDSSDASTTSVIENPSADTKILTPEPSEKPEQNLTKSVSAETITGETSSANESVAEARPLQKSSSKFDISSIKSKFRKIRMRKDKDSKLNAVAVLCRQSLFIEVPKASESSSISKSCPSSPVMDRNKQENSSQSSKK